MTFLSAGYIFLGSRFPNLPELAERRLQLTRPPPSHTFDSSGCAGAVLRERSPLSSGLGSDRQERNAPRCVPPPAVRDRAAGSPRESPASPPGACQKTRPVLVAANPVPRFRNRPAS